MSLDRNNRCIECKVKVPRHRPILVCDICNNHKHYRCQGLSKSEALHIISASPNGNTWSCPDCIRNAIPVDASNTQSPRPRNTEPRFKVKCSCCNGMSYSKKNVDVCIWCDQICHVKCINKTLGCKKCCEQIFPGFNVHCFELYSTTPTRNSALFNPYSNFHNSNIVGDMIDQEEHNNNLFNDISETLINCRYRQPKHVKFAEKFELNTFSLNIRSLYNKIPKIRDDLADYLKYDVLCFNETNCDVDSLPNGFDDLTLEGFHPPIVQAPYRSSNKGGGLACYINMRICSADDIEKLELELDPPSADGEFSLIKIKNCLKTNKTIILANAYRSPSRKPAKFNDLLEVVLGRLDRHRTKQIVLLGDFNIDLIKYESDINSQKLIDLTASKGFVQVISRPTRITDHSATLIDHIYTNKIENLVSASVLTVDLSDHLATFATFSLDRGAAYSHILHNNNDSTRPSEFRLFNEANDEKFKQLIAEETWDIPDGLDAQEQYDSFINIYTLHYNTAYPLITNRVRRKHERLTPKPWILPWLEDACARKNDQFEKFVESPTPENKIKYDKMKVFTEKHAALAKNKYHKKFFEQHKDNSKKQWQMINNLLNRKRKKSETIKLKDDDGNLINTPNLVADKFNNYFTNIAHNLKMNTRNNDQPNQNNASDFHKSMPEPVPNSMYIRPVDSSEIYEVIKNLKNKATLDSKINPLKIANTDFKFTACLAKIVTSSFEQGIFPQALKLARVVPIYKSGQKTDVSNYRPISLLSSFSKIYEKMMHKRVVEFMEGNESLHDLQFGFRAGRSCEHALLTAQNTIQHALSKKQISLLLLIDFSKAFDMVEYPILLSKLHNYGIRGNVLNWFQSYLDGREQFVSVSGADSDKTTLRYGVPQGSILGPLLFIIYINDLPKISSSAKFILYADDANIFVSGSTMAEVEQQIRELAPLLVSWVDANGLKLNLKKTNYMIFSNIKSTTGSHFSLFVNNTLIVRQSEAKFLGVIIDEKLTWAQHIKAVKTKMSRYTGIMYRIKGLLPITARLQIYHSFVQSYINFCSLVWGFAAKSHIEKLFAGQKKGMRAAMPGYINYFYRDDVHPSHTKTSFNKYDVLSVHNIITTNALTFIHKYFNFPQSLPASVRDTICNNAPREAADVENCTEWYEYYSNPIFLKSVFFKGPLLYTDPKFKSLISPVTCLSFKAYRNNAKRFLINLQKLEDPENPEEWQAGNFALHQIQGLKRSKRIMAQ